MVDRWQMLATGPISLMKAEKSYKSSKVHHRRHPSNRVKDFSKSGVRNTLQTRFQGDAIDHFLWKMSIRQSLLPGTHRVLVLAKVPPCPRRVTT